MPHEASLTAVLQGVMCCVALSADPACWGVNTSRERCPKHPVSGESRPFCQPAFEAALYLREKETHHVSLDLPRLHLRGGKPAPHCIGGLGQRFSERVQAHRKRPSTRPSPAARSSRWAFQGQHLRRSPSCASSSHQRDPSRLTQTSRRARVYFKVFSFL